MTTTPYDEFPYPAGAYAQSHPDRLEALALLFGMTSPDIRRCRVLELGCANGANLIPMACALPESRFVGVDLAHSQIQAGQEAIAVLGLGNIELRHLDLRAIDDGFGVFDYVVAHGVYSWVPAGAQERILAICRERLAPNGVAYVSYNTYPGWRMRGLLRDMMLYHSRKFDDPQHQIQQARALIQWLGESVRVENNPYGLLLKNELEQMQHWQDTYFRHDSLEEINEPVYFHQFIERAERHGLQYLAEAELPSMLASNFGAPIDATLERLGRDILEMEQYMDFVRNRMFRQTLLCHREVRLNRALGPASLIGFYVAAPLRPANASPDLVSRTAEPFQTPGGMVVSSGQPVTKAALLCLGELWPEPIPFMELLARARARLIEAAAKPGNTPRAIVEDEADRLELGGALLTCVTKGAVELHAHGGTFVTVPGKRPRACPWVRWQAARGNAVTNRRHERVVLDTFDRHLLPWLDGEHDLEALGEAVRRLAAEGALTVKRDGRPFEDPAEAQTVLVQEMAARLPRLGRQALLI